MTERFETYPLPSSEIPRAMYEYIVTGRGGFPLDMLRYDCCWPVKSQDAANLDFDANRKLRSVRMRSYRKPTVERWASFLWSVGPLTGGD